MEILIKDIKILRRNSEEIIILKNAWLLTILSSYESRIINFVNDLFMVSLLKEYLPLLPWGNRLMSYLNGR